LTTDSFVSQTLFAIGGGKRYCQYGGRVNTQCVKVRNNNMRDTAVLREHSRNSTEKHAGKENFYSQYYTCVTII